MNLFNDQLNANFKWFVGIIEDVNDPNQAGRVKVRCFGIHTSDKKLLPTDDLPWASVMSPTTNANYKGINSPVHGLMEGSSVVGFFMDGDSAQIPLVIGSLPGIAPTNPPNSQTSYATESRSINFVPGENDYGILATSTESEITSHSMRNYMDLTQQTAVLCAAPAEVAKIDGDSHSSLFFERPTWDEPVGRSGEVRGFYPYTKTEESKSGHVIEVDDNPDNPRLLWYHADGTFEEFTSGGRHLKVIGANYEVIVGKNNVYINGDCNLTVAGDMRQLVQGNYYLEVMKDYTVQVHGSMKRQITANDLKQINGSESKDINIDAIQMVNGTLSHRVGRKIKHIVGEDYDITSGTSYSVNAGISVAGVGFGLIQLNSGGTLDLVGTNSASIKGLLTNIGDVSVPLGVVNIIGNAGIINTSTNIISNAAPVITLTAAGNITAVAPAINLN